MAYVLYANCVNFSCPASEDKPVVSIRSDDLDWLSKKFEFDDEEKELIGTCKQCSAALQPAFIEDEETGEKVY